MNENNQYKILIIEDDNDIRELIRLQLKLQNYQTFIATSGSEAFEQIENNDFHLLIVDRMLPDTNGIDICLKVRANPKTTKIPIIFLTALAEPQNIIEGLDAGAEDYITKPFDINILHARVRSQLRRANPESKKDINQLTFGDLTINQSKCRVEVSDDEINLTNTEFQILSALCLKPGIVHTREKLILDILGDDVHVTNRTIDTHIAGLRKKLGPYAKLIETIRGVGYRLKDNE